MGNNCPIFVIYSTDENIMNSFQILKRNEIHYAFNR